MFQSDLAALGVNARIETLGFAEYAATRTEARFPALLSHAYIYADSDPALAFTAGVLRTDGNLTHFKSDAYAELVNAAKLEPDSSKRLARYRQIAQLVRDEAFLIPIANLVTPWAMRRTVHGFKVLPSVSTAPVYEDLWLG